MEPTRRTWCTLWLLQCILQLNSHKFKVVCALPIVGIHWTWHACILIVVAWSGNAISINRMKQRSDIPKSIGGCKQRHASKPWITIVCNEKVPWISWGRHQPCVSRLIGRALKAPVKPEGAWLTVGLKHLSAEI